MSRSKISDGRMQLPEEAFQAAAKEAAEKLAYRMEEKGLGTLTSSHEILGIITEEYFEFIEEVKSNSSDEMKVQELLDIAVAAIFGVASIRGGGTHW
jgi:hypothetical protein